MYVQVLDPPAAHAPSELHRASTDVTVPDTEHVSVTEACPPGTVSLTFHFAETPTNVLTHAALDPVAKIPETKVCAVRVEAL